MLFRIPSRHRHGADHAPAADIRRLGLNDAGLFGRHLHDLAHEDFRDRFNGLVSDEWLDGYIARSLKHGIVLGAFDADRLVAVAELHRGRDSRSGQAESAFSVLTDWRRKGLGTALIAALLVAAREDGLSDVIVETGSQNVAMKALANKFGAHMHFDGEQSTGHIDVREGLRLAADAGVATNAAAGADESTAERRAR